MSKLSTSSTIKLPAPTMGVDWTVPTSAVQYPYSPCSFDWIANGYSVRMRDRHSRMLNLPTANFSAIASHNASGDLLLGVSTGFYTYDTATQVLGPLRGAGFDGIWYDSVNYQGRVFLDRGSSTGSWDGSTFTSLAFTASVLGSWGKSACCIYRDRYYNVVQQQLNYAELPGATSGTLKTFDLKSYYTRGAFCACATVSVKDSNSLADYLILVSDGGDVVVFTGDFPGSANWQLVSRIYIGSINNSLGNLNIIKCVQFGNDAFLIVGSPVLVLSLRTLISEGLTVAQQRSPIAKAAPLIRQDRSSVCYGAQIFEKEKALLLQFYNASVSSLFFGFTPGLTNYWWLYIDLDSGAISPFSYPEEGQLPFDNAQVSTSHSDGYVYGLSFFSEKLYRLFDPTQSDATLESGSFLQFPSTNLESPNAIKTLLMGYPLLSRKGGYVEAKLAVAYDLDRVNPSTFSSPNGSTFSGIESKRLNIPLAGAGEQISIAFINPLRSGLVAEELGVQFETGGPY